MPATLQNKPQSLVKTGQPRRRQTAAIQFTPEPLKQLRSRFHDALAVPVDIASGQMLDDCHRFDFEDGYRLSIARDYQDGSILVFGGPVNQPPTLLTHVATRVAGHFSDLSDTQYGFGELLAFRSNLVALLFQPNGSVRTV